MDRPIRNRRRWVAARHRRGATAMSEDVPGQASGFVCAQLGDSSNDDIRKRLAEEVAQASLELIGRDADERLSGRADVRREVAVVGRKAADDDAVGHGGDGSA